MLKFVHIELYMLGRRVDEFPILNDVGAGPGSAFEGLYTGYPVINV